MFCTTFYSYKGGVGRTLALANVAVVMARRKKKVLVVDFDLEAPGLTTLDVFGASRTKPGIIEFVQEFRTTGAAPDALRFIHPCVIPDEKAEGSAADVSIDVMPAGADAGYPDRFGKSDWDELYGEHNGFLLIEDLRAQWNSLGYDYVFVDSRTGLTDVGGICTRQLPDLTVIVFFPNEQNLVGLKDVVQQIREGSGRPKQIELLFAASRLPRLDDEEGVLRGWLSRFQNVLEYEAEQLCKIEHYDSLTLLDQALFVLSRPKSGLAKQYVALATALTRRNIEDADGVLGFISDVSMPRRRGEEWVFGASGASADEREKLELLVRKHAKDYVVQHALAELFYEWRQLDRALAVVDQGLGALGTTAVTGPVAPTIPSGLHQLRLKLFRDLDVTDIGPITSSAAAILSDPHADDVKIVDALVALGDADPSKLPQPDDVPGLNSRSAADAITIATTLSAATSTLYLAFEIAWRTVQDGRAPDVDSDKALDLLILLIAGHRYDAALVAAERIGEESAFYQVAKTFNVAMAKWGLSQVPDQDFFSRVVNLAASVTDYHEMANFNQCLGLAHAVLGNDDEMSRSLKNARDAVAGLVREYSCWTFTRVSRREFLDHCDAIEKFAEGRGDPPQVVKGDDQPRPFAR
jgi:MinD-like ATPase involved in chromosome partitioning or flagellar assembly